MLKNILWDFDETILPLDQDESLIEDVLKEMNGKPIFFWKWFLSRFYYLFTTLGFDYKYTKRVLQKVYNGMPSSFFESCSATYAKKIPKSYVRLLKKAKKKGYRNYIISCGNTQVINDILSNVGILDCFEGVISNTLIFNKDIAVGTDYRVDSAKKTPLIMKELGIKGEESMVIGDGIYDIPMLREAAKPVLIGRKKMMIELGKQEGWIILDDLAEVEPLL